MDYFKITVTSKTECVFKNSNRAGKFRAHLGRNLELPGKWSVALFEVIYPGTFENLRREDCRIICKSKENIQTFLIRRGFYCNASTLVEEINRVMAGHFVLHLGTDNYLQLVFDHTAGTQSYLIPTTLQDIFGFERFPAILGIGEIHGRYPCDPSRGSPHFFSIETDIIREQFVNNGHQKNLRIFTPSADSTCFGISRSKTFEKLLFVPVSRNNLESIDFHITDERGQEVLFAYGAFSVVLVFKRNGHGF